MRAAIPFVSAPPDPLPDLLMSWEFRSLRGEIRLPITSLRRAAEDPALAWQLEQDDQFGIGYLADRKDVLEDTIRRWKRAKARPSLHAVIAVRARLLIGAGRMRVPTLLTRFDKRIRHERARAIRALTTLRGLHVNSRALFTDDEFERLLPITPNPPAVYQAALDLLTSDDPDKRDRLIAPMHRRTNTRGNPEARLLAHAHAELAKLHVSENDRSSLLQAMGLLPFARFDQ